MRPSTEDQTVSKRTSYGCSCWLLGGSKVAFQKAVPWPRSALEFSNMGTDSFSISRRGIGTILQPTCDQVNQVIVCAGYGTCCRAQGREAFGTETPHLLTFWCWSTAVAAITRISLLASHVWHLAESFRISSRSRAHESQQLDA